MSKILKPTFFSQPTILVAQKLLGKFLVRKIGGKNIAKKITEVEVYDGIKDRGSHAFRGQTKRNFVMFGPAGYWYVYLNYGMHWMLNIVTENKNYPAAILIRGVDGISGPGKVTKFFKINKFFNNKLALPKNKLWIEDRGIKIKKSQIKKGPRIGIDYAGPYWSKRHLRFWIE
ncbi:MAG: DNA-3-methyladenine glycosylase [Patescibacteria group bacterium]|nr:DNA-3-methyladenine glycosylase [Patescibacteria group bacterium]MDW8279860.1 DNA-3-methyladenine glycosylase [bacterium]